jgi:polysaccharide biosynthesis transport protein
MELRQYVNTLLKWWWLIVASVAIATVSSYFGTLAIAPTYQASTTLMVGQALQNPNPSTAEFYTGQVLAQSYVDLLRRQPVMEGTLKTLGLTWDWRVLQEMVSSRVIASTQLLEISVLDTDPQRVSVLADEIARQLILQSPAGTDPAAAANREFVLTQIEDLKTKIKNSQDEQRQLDDTIAKANSARQIEDARTRQAALQSQVSIWQATYAQLLTNLQQGTPNFLSIVESAQAPTEPVGPRLGENLLLAAVIGLVLAVGAAFLAEYIDDTLKSPDDVQQTLGLTTIGGIARIAGDDYPSKLITVEEPRSVIAEAYRVLRTNLQFSAVDRPLRTVMVTSPNPVEGKSVTAANLAVVIAQSGKRVILIDADLRRPVQHRIFSMSNNLGLTNLLSDSSVQPDDALQATPVDNLRVIASGPLPPNPSEMLGSKRMSDLIEMLKQQSDTIVFDSPPVMAVTDATVLATRVDGCLLVVDAGRTRRNAAKRSKDALLAVGAQVYGIALNRLTSRNGGPYYHYYYSEDGQHRRQKSRSASANLLARVLNRNGHRPHANGTARAAEPETETETHLSAKP